VIQPRARSYESFSKSNEGPCGAQEKGPTHLMAQLGSVERFHWHTVKGHPMANCTIAISPGSANEADFRVLRPRDGSSNLDGEFACGRKSGYEWKDFKLPKDLVCESCTL
jgi:hypothetical protein